MHIGTGVQTVFLGKILLCQRFYEIWEKFGILYGGLAELIVNAMVDIKQPFIKWEWR